MCVTISAVGISSAGLRHCVHSMRTTGVGIGSSSAHLGRSVHCLFVSALLEFDVVYVACVPLVMGTAAAAIVFGCVMLILRC